MARPRRQIDTEALFVRIPSAEAAKLHRAADVLKTPKRELITKLVARYVDPEDPAALTELGGPAESELAVGRHWFRPTEEPEVLTPAELADLLQVEEQAVVDLAERSEIPARKVGDDWRFSRKAILAWLGEGDEE
jgi:excisionase family DNA binding protein